MTKDVQKVVETPVSQLSHLKAEELTRFATHLAAANLHTLLDRREEIKSLSTEDIRKMVDLGNATRAHCGGIDCG